MNKYETVIGIEVHVELSTKSKMFCGCSTKFGAPANTHTCPICLGHPGVLPVINKKAVDYAIKAALVLNCEIAPFSKFDRKNYFYPDSPKAYQISQFDQPIGQNGWIEIEVKGNKKRIGITRLHLEEDAGKLSHMEKGMGSLIDFNRVGVPLIEIVSEPDISSPEEAKAYLEKLKTLIQYSAVSDVKMEEGSLRCDANISLRIAGDTKLGTKTEMKNLNSFRNVEKALKYEQDRQAELLDQGQKIRQQTLRWLENENKTELMRDKEDAHDYRYFPEPDLVSMHISESWIDEIRQSLVELPDVRKERYVEEYGLSDYDASILVSSRWIADFFDHTVLNNKVSPKIVCNWITSDLLGYLHSEDIEMSQLKLTPFSLSRLIQLIDEGVISTTIAKKVFREMLNTGKKPDQVIEEQGLIQISDEVSLKKEVKKVLAIYPQSIEDIKNGKDRAFGFLVGQVMKATRGKANPQIVNQLIRDEIQGV